jgi:hypothetical protein
VWRRAATARPTTGRHGKSSKRGTTATKVNVWMVTESFEMLKIVQQKRIFGHRGPGSLMAVGMSYVARAFLGIYRDTFVPHPSRNDASACLLYQQQVSLYTT